MTAEFRLYDIPRLLKPILDEKAHLVLGKREEISRISERFINRLTNLRVKVADSGTGFRAIKREFAVVTANCRLPAVLITGGCGFIGTNLVNYLSERGYAVRILDNLATASPVWTADGRSTAGYRLSTVELVRSDIRDREAVAKAVDGVDAVVHLAAHTSVVESVENPEEDWDINVNGTLNILEACRRNGVGSFIFASSNAVVGEQEPPIDETKIPQPLSPYGASKLAAEALCSAYYHSFGLKTIALRFANVYGPHSEHKPSVIAKFMKQARDGEPLIIYGDGNQTRDFVHVDDVCQAIYLALTTDRQPPNPLNPPTQSTQETGLTADFWGGIFQIGSGVETTINQLARLINEIAEKSPRSAVRRPPSVYQPARPGEIKRNYSDITKARTVLGFEPGTSLQRGLSSVWKRTNERRV